MSDLATEIIMFESGELDDQGILELFSKLIKDGLAWKLQGSYGRMAGHLIDAGIISEDGKILK